MNLVLQPLTKNLPSKKPFYRPVPPNWPIIFASIKLLGSKTANAK
jgi:hypothetical protein